MDTMKHLALLTLLVLMLETMPANGQVPSDSTKPKAALTADSSAGAVNPQRGNDRFIDADGDGICDGRAKGLGLRHGADRGRGQGKDATNGQRRLRGGRK